jgi:hypothetical protein
MIRSLTPPKAAGNALAAGFSLILILRTSSNLSLGPKKCEKKVSLLIDYRREMITPLKMNLSSLKEALLPVMLFF